MVIDKVDYDNKIKDHLNDETTHEKLQQNPFKSLQLKLNNLLMKLKKKGSLSPEEYRNLYSSTDVTPIFYALIKIHKQGNPIRPIV